MVRAPFVSLDGLDGTGKSTQCRLLAEWLRGRGLAVTECADPGGTAVGGATFDVSAPVTGRLAERFVLPPDEVKAQAVLGEVIAD